MTASRPATRTAVQVVAMARGPWPRDRLRMALWALWNARARASRGGRPSARRPGTSSRSVATARSLATYPCGCPPSPSATAYKDAPGPARSRRSTRSSLVPRTRPASLTAVPCATNPLIPGPRDRPAGPHPPAPRGRHAVSCPRAGPSRLTEDLQHHGPYVHPVPGAEDDGGRPERTPVHPRPVRAAEVAHRHPALRAHQPEMRPAHGGVGQDDILVRPPPHRHDRLGERVLAAHEPPRARLDPKAGMGGGPGHGPVDLGVRCLRHTHPPPGRRPSPPAGPGAAPPDPSPPAPRERRLRDRGPARRPPRACGQPELAAGRLDLRPPLDPDGDREARPPEDPGEGPDPLGGRPAEGEAGDGVQGDDVDVAPQAPEEPGQGPRVVRRVVGAVDEDVLEGDAPARLRHVLPAGVQHLRERVAAVHRHQR